MFTVGIISSNSREKYIDFTMMMCVYFFYVYKRNII